MQTITSIGRCRLVLALPLRSGACDAQAWERGVSTASRPPLLPVYEFNLRALHGYL